ncbi:RNA polymerase sigma-70 factor [Mucilaginibacter sp. 10B2]|uniref:RNA polymerase sigma-70 factor n=1 Tax=Mucilaginibacter sp. 10B2 TaxID=3048574 RepID=UPI002B2364C0|nr:RNA polymerase sigma-70 factor [Mucilaginibacter sp. 10B2]MEB0280700.1 RNA polymerase sigma-70 factor [Mucilaginibacter sp. 10B2]
MQEYKSFSDNELVQLLKQSDHSAYNELYHRYFYLTYTHTYKKLRDEEQAKDIVQEVFVALWFNREYKLPDTNLAGYLFTAVRNKIFDLFAHEQVKTKHLDSLKDYERTHQSVPTDYLIREKDMNAYIEKSIQALPLKMKQIFEMSRKEHLTYKEIAEQLDVTENNVSKQVNNALRILRTRLGLLIWVAILLKL